MKKLMFVAALVCAATVSYGTAANWQASASEICDGTADETYAIGMTAYFFDSGLMAQSALYNIWAAGTTIGSGTAGYVGQSDVTDGGALSLNFTHGEQGGSDAYSYYFAILDENEKIYFSNISDPKTPSATSSAKVVAFNDQVDYGDPSVIPNSNALPVGTGYKGAGVWSAYEAPGPEPVPEPFSGTLALLGMGVVALRRRMKKA